MTHTLVLLDLVEATYKVDEYLKDVRIVQLERIKPLLNPSLRAPCFCQRVISLPPGKHTEEDVIRGYSVWCVRRVIDKGAMKAGSDCPDYPKRCIVQERCTTRYASSWNVRQSSARTFYLPSLSDCVEHGATCNEDILLHPSVFVPADHVPFEMRTTSSPSRQLLGLIRDKVCPDYELILIHAYPQIRARILFQEHSRIGLD
ncbi:uncharacterized protein ARMOST_17321 [Armillaria ostoyae]|uniref:Uncharacterized protein n=1 Tax=Armillaria ostoyae TaxID=47428 RepID=A0A284RYM6_ARMOS|nr:uncharacterized protein ARMOST_17321 [Armillaria ostoyae]